MTVTFAPFIVYSEEGANELIQWLVKICGKPADHFDYRKQKYFFDAVHSEEREGTTLIVGSIDKIDSESQLATARDAMEGIERTIRRADGTWWTKKSLWAIAFDPKSTQKAFILVIESDCSEKAFFKAVNKFKLDSIELIFNLEDFYEMVDEVKTIEWDHIGSVPLIPENSPHDAFTAALKDMQEHIDHCTRKYKASFKKESRANNSLKKIVTSSVFRKRARTSVTWRSGYEDLSTYIQEGKQKIRPKLNIENSNDSRTEKSIRNLFFEEFLRWYLKFEPAIRRTKQGAAHDDE